MAKITIFGLSGCGKTTIAKLLAEKLNLPLILVGDLMREYAPQLGITFEELKEVRKKDPKYDLKLDEYIKEYGKTHDNFVMESRLPWYFVPDSFKIKLTYEFDERINRIREREGNSFEKQKEVTLYRDKSDQELWKKLYGIEDAGADEHFDFIIDVTKPNPEEIVKKIISVIY